MERGDRLEVAGHDQGRRRVAERREQDLREGPGVAAGEVRDGQDRHSAEAETEPRQAARAKALRVSEEAGQDGADDRHGGDQEARGGAGEVALGVRQGPPGAQDLDAGKGQHRLPVGAQDAGETPLPQGERQQQCGAERAAGEDHHGG
ncbi:hypothetical protein OG302_29090 [Streptomyces sp. NBC_01283]|nr:hypothetical protein OG302_29090 [Streptomyces sp. NBC_01283]